MKASDTAGVRNSLRAVVATDEAISSREIQAFLAAAGLEVVGESPRWDDVLELAATRAPDLAVVAGGPSFAAGAASLPPNIPALVLAPDEERAAGYADVPAYAILTCASPPDWVATTASLAVARAADLAAARREADALKDQLETRKLVERAKGVLMKRLHLAEEDAYKRLQKASQDENRKLREIAESVLRAEKVFDLNSLGEKTAGKSEKKPERVRDAG